MREGSFPARPILPPPFEAIRHDGPSRVLEAAIALAPEKGAGTLVWTERPGVFGLAVVLEPERPLAEARPAALIGMAALAEAIAAHCPPERQVTIRWPDTILYEGARLGGGTLAWPEDAADADEPDWMVFAAELLAERGGLDAPGRYPDSTSLAEEGFEDSLDLVESFARHLMLLFDIWRVRGLAAATRPYLDRLDGRTEWWGVDRSGDLLERAASGAQQRRPLAPALAARGWDDPARGGPRW